MSSDNTSPVRSRQCLPCGAVCAPREQRCQKCTAATADIVANCIFSCYEYCMSMGFAQTFQVFGILCYEMGMPGPDMGSGICHAECTPACSLTQCAQAVAQRMCVCLPAAASCLMLE